MCFQERPKSRTDETEDLGGDKSSAISKFPSTRSLYMSPTPLAAPDVTLTIRRSKRSSADVMSTPRDTEETDSSGQKSEPSKANENDSDEVRQHTWYSGI